MGPGFKPQRGGNKAYFLFAMPGYLPAMPGGHAHLPAEKLQATEGAMPGRKAGVSFLALWGLEGRDPLLHMVCPSLLP